MNKAKFATQVAQLTAERKPFVLATVVRARRPASVTPGDTAVVLPDGTIEGFVGGQCAETSVRLYSLRALETGEPMLLRLIPGAADGEEVDDGIDGAIVEHNPCLSGGALEIFLEPQLPPARMVITGDSPISRAVVALATVSGHEVQSGSVIDPEQVTGATALIVASHGHDEEDVLRAALSAGVPYVGLVASTTRGAAVRDALGLAPELAAQLHTPAGVDIGAQTPAEIAISILAEVVVVMHSNPGSEPLVDGEPGSLLAAEPESHAAPEPETQEVLEPEQPPVTEPSPASEPAPSVPTPSAPELNSASDLPSAEPALSRRHAGAAMLARAFAPGKRDSDTAEEFDDHQRHVSYSYGDAAETPEATATAAGTDADEELISETAEDGSELQLAIDPVCGMKVPVIESTLHLDVVGSRKYFCGTGCRVAYAAKHVPDDNAQ